MPKILSLPVDEIASLRSRVRHHRLVPAGATPAQIAEHAARVRELWTPERRRAAIPPPMPPAREMAAGEDAPEDVTKPTRVPAKQLGTPPYSSVGKFLFQFEEGGMYHRGSGFAVGPNLVMTAAHCVVSLRDKRPPQPAINVLFEPQFDDGDSPLGSFAGVDVFYMLDYTHADGDVAFDFGFALVQPMPSGVPGLPLDFLEPSSGSVNALGYPIDKNGKFHFDQGERMWEQPSSYRQKTIKQSSFLRMPSMFTPGASGGPWIDSQSQQVVSLNSTRSGEERIDGPILGSAAYVLYQTVSGAMVNWAVDTNCGNYVTSVLFSPTNNVAYTGVNGYAYGYDIANGTQGAYNRLTGYRHNELRFATDGTNLYVGTNGYLLALPLDNFDDELAQIGEMQVGGPTTVLWDAGTSSLYAGATAQVCRLTGSQLSYNTLKGLQGGDVDLVT
ncbi:MAG: trypsin-like serine peptidase, partial [Kofleriaceae bacterium]